ncbi:MAG: putative lipoic acid-binding regulatory protein [Parasphingorhabdus sp.]|jgi:putative lipoic acid-binding regulatory protein
MQNKSSDTLLEFPCEFTLKAMGLQSGDFQSIVENIVKRHLDSTASISGKANQSSKGKYMSISVSFTASSKPQIDAIYMDLSSESRVLVAL